MRALDHDDVVERSVREAREDVGEEELLLRRAEPGRSAGREDDGRDAGHGREAAVTDSTTIGWSGASDVGSPSEPISSTTSRPSVTSPTTA